MINNSTPLDELGLMNESSIKKKFEEGGRHLQNI